MSSQHISTGLGRDRRFLTLRVEWRASQAYGPHGLGILTVAGVPSLPELRQQLLPLSAEFVVRASPSHNSLSSPNTMQPFLQKHFQDPASLLHVHSFLACLHLSFIITTRLGETKHEMPEIAMSRLACMRSGCRRRFKRGTRTQRAATALGGAMGARPWRMVRSTPLRVPIMPTPWWRTLTCRRTFSQSTLPTAGEE